MSEELLNVPEEEISGEQIEQIKESLMSEYDCEDQVSKMLIDAEFVGIVNGYKVVYSNGVIDNYLFDEYGDLIHEDDVPEAFYG